MGNIRDSVESHAVKIRRRSSGAGVRMLLQNRENFGRSSPPARFMFYDNEGSWRDFPPETIAEVRRAFVMRQPAAEIRAFGSEFVVDFLRMAAVDVRSGAEQSVAWIDDRENCFFPREFIGPGRAHDGPGEIVVEVQIEAAKKRKIGDEEEVEEEADVSSTKEAEVMPKRPRLAADDVAESSPWPKARRVGAGEVPHALVKSKLLAGMSAAGLDAEVTAVYSWTSVGEKDKAREEVFRKQEEITRAHRGRGSTTTVEAWFGGSKKAIEWILSHGFAAGWISGKLDCYGVGIHLSRITLPHLSAEIAELDERGEKHLLLCQVILGNMEKVEKGSSQCVPSSPDFDTGCDDPNRLRWHIVWPTHMGRFILPKYVVSFKPSNLAKGQIDAHLPPVLREHYSFGMLIPRLQALLPARSQELVTLYGQYRAGKLQRADFVKQLRCVAGDQTLRSVVQQIRGF